VRKRVYIAGPITKGDLAHNIRQAEAAFYALLKAGLAPLCPHWSCYGSGPQVTTFGTVYATAAAVHPGTTHDDWLDADLPWVAVSHAVLRLPGESSGADKEVALAGSLGIPVFDSVDAVVAWLKG
jgi:hypothetical protein